MNTIILSIHPIFADQIMQGTKQFEFRTRVANMRVDRIVVYATAPESQVIGEVLVEETICQSPIDLWERTSSLAGISQQRFFEYFKNRNRAYAYVLYSPRRYTEPRPLGDFGLTSAPQSFAYIR